jgi:hypothetical protein
VQVDALSCLQEFRTEALLGSFGVSRLANFFFAVRIFWQELFRAVPGVLEFVCWETMLNRVQVKGIS